jgi:anion-transporting  ArsA/GET3 family ATPase
MEAGFKERAAHVQALLSDPATAYLLVASPRRDTVAEASWFAERLRSSHLPVEALVVNRVHPRFDDGSAEADRLRAETLAGTPLGGLYANLADFRTMAEGEEAHLAGLSAAVEPAPVLRVPFLADDVHDVDTLEQVAGHLFGRAAPSS